MSILDVCGSSIEAYSFINGMTERKPTLKIKNFNDLEKANQLTLHHFATVHNAVDRRIAVIGDLIRCAFAGQIIR